MTGEAFESIEADLEKLKHDFPKMKEKIDKAKDEIKKLVDENGNMTRANKHVKIIENLIKEILEDKLRVTITLEKKIKIKIEDILYKPLIDLHFLINNKGKAIHIFLEYKRWLKDSNQIRSAILNSLLIKEYGKKSGYENSYSYLIGGGVDSADEIKEKKTDVISQLILWAEKKEYLKAYSARELNKLIDDIKNKLET